MSPCTHWYFNEFWFIPTFPSVTVTVVLCDFAHVVFPFGLNVTVGSELSKLNGLEYFLVVPESTATFPALSFA